MVKIPKPQPMPPLQVRIPIIQDKASFIKRMAAFALVILLLYYAVLSYTEAQTSAKSLTQVTADLAQARAERRALIKLVISQNEAIRNLGGQPIDPFTAGLLAPSPSPAPSPAPPAQSTPSRTNRRPSSKPKSTRSTPKPAPRPSPTPSQTPKPAPRPSPSPTPQPVLCVDTELGRVCTPAL